MKNVIVNSCVGLIKDTGKYDDITLEEIKYGLASIYLLISKSIIIFTLAYLLGIFKEMLIFTIFYNIIRMPSFGLHATKSWICLLTSTLVFLTVPYTCTKLSIPIIVKAIVGMLTILLIYKNAPADTYKKPIVSKKRRDVYKFLSTVIAILFVFLSFFTSKFISNALLSALIYQCFITAPTVYKIFKLPYDNYKNYQQSIMV